METHPPKRNPFLVGITRLFAFIGIMALLYLIVGVSQDIAEFDPTSGGYDYPYAGWVGTPIDYSAMYITPDGLYKRGRVVELYFNCHTGMISYAILGMVKGDFRVFSDRAKVVHQPQVTCRAFGFDTSAWDAIHDPDGLFIDL